MDLPKFEYLYFYRHKPDTYVKRHYHNCHELTYYVSGTSSSVMRNKTFKCSEGNFLIYPKGVIHDETHFSPVQVLCLGFHLDDFQNIFNTDSIFYDNDQSILKILEEMQIETTNDELDFQEMCDLLTEKICIILRRKKQGSPLNRGFFSVLKYINESFTGDIDLNKLADMSEYSYDRFRHIFKQKTGLSPLNYILQKKIDYAKILLSNSTYNITDIATQCGFCNISQFSVSFKKATGLSPIEYRKKNYRVLNT